MPRATRLSAWRRWTPLGRGVVFALASTSIGCLLAEFYRPGSMRAVTLVVFLPALMALALISAWDGLRGDGRLCRGVVIGTTSGLIAAAAYDLFRVPFVFADSRGIGSVVPPLNLFKVFPRFGAMILGQPTEPMPTSWPSHPIGWAYHFSPTPIRGLSQTVGAVTRDSSPARGIVPSMLLPASSETPGGPASRLRSFQARSVSSCPPGR